MGCGYIDAIVTNDISMDRVHISAVLDHDRRSVTSALVSIICSGALVGLEVTRRSNGHADGPKQRASRHTPYSRERISLATCCGAGILVVCLVRESSFFFVHAGAAAVAFGAAVMLVWLNALLVPLEEAASRKRALRLAFGLSAICCITGTAQGLSIIEYIAFPSALLAIGEWFLVVGFAIAISVI